MKKFVFFLVGLFLIPIVKADTYTGFVVADRPYLLPIAIVVEILFAYFLLKNTNIDLKPWYLILMIVAANIFSALFGVFLFMFSMAGLASIISTGINNTIIFIIAYIFTVLLEWLIIYFFIKNKVENPWKEALKISVLINIVSYLIMIALFYAIPKKNYFP